MGNNDFICSICGESADLADMYADYCHAPYLVHYKTRCSGAVIRRGGEALRFKDVSDKQKTWHEGIYAPRRAKLQEEFRKNREQRRRSLREAA